MRFAVGAKTDVGRGRPANEDSFLVDHDGRLYAVADGMGGHRGGEVASATAITALQAAFAKGAALEEAVGEANAAVFAKASANLDLRGMGTTLTAVSLDDHTVLLGHVGDSRAYLMRDGGVRRITEDHSLVEQLVREGRLSPEEAADHPQRAIITRALGIDPEVEVDTYPVDLRPGDRLLLCSDGLTNMVSDTAIEEVLRRRPDPQEAAEVLVDMANEVGGDDNITIVIIDAHDGVAEGVAGSARSAVADEPTGEWYPFEEDEGSEASSAADGPGAADDESGAEAVPPAPEGGPRRRRRLPRALAWILSVLLLAGAALGVTGWYARRTFYVGLSGDRVTLYRGVPGGVLGWDPTVERHTDVRSAELTAADRADLEDGQRFSSHSDAVGYLERLERRIASASAPPADDPVVTTTTTLR